VTTSLDQRIAFDHRLNPRPGHSDLRPTKRLSITWGMKLSYAPDIYIDPDVDPYHMQP